MNTYFRVFITTFFAIVITSTAIADDLESLEDFTVLTPSKMRQSLADSPASVSVIKGDTIRGLGLTSIAEVFRLVPGFNVSYLAPLPNVNRGNGFVIGKRLKVMLDGIPMENPFYHRVDWLDIPVAIESIDRIEVVRSQSAASYGANAFYGTINIITKHPEDSDAGYIVANGSELESNVSAGVANTIGNTAFRIEARARKHEMFETWGTPETEEREDDFENSSVQLKTVTAFNDQHSLETFWSYGESEYDVDPLSSDFDLSSPGEETERYKGALAYSFLTESNDLNVKLSHSHSEYDYNWRVAVPAFFFYPELVALAATNPVLVKNALLFQDTTGATMEELMALGAIQQMIATDPNSMNMYAGDVIIEYATDRTELDVSNVAQIGDNTRIQAGYNIKKYTLDSHTYGRGTFDLYKSSIQSNVEHKFTDWLTVNVGVMFESLDKSFDDIETSPKVALNFHVDPMNTIRFIASQGKRTVDGIELVENFSYDMQLDGEAEINGQNIVTPFVGSFPPSTLGNNVETIDAIELSYFSNIIPNTLTLDLRAYSEQMKDTYANEVGGFSGTEDFDRLGFDSELVYTSSDLSAGLNAFYIDTETQTDALEGISFNDFFAYGGSIYGMYKLPSDWMISSAFYWSSGHSNNSRFQRGDARLSKMFDLNAASLELALTYRNHLKSYSRESDYDRPDDGIRENKDEFMAEVALRF